MDIKELKAERLKEARKKAGYDTAEGAADAFGWKAAGYRHHENGTRGFGGDAATKYAKAFRVRAAWLMGMDDNGNPPPPPPSDDILSVNGAVAAGVWRESEHWNDDRSFELDLPSPVKGARRFGVVVEGLSMNEFYQPGDVLDCISIFKGGVRPSHGDHVIVERENADGLRELTVKEYQDDGPKRLLVPRSTKPEFKPIEYPGPDHENETGERIQVIAFVVAFYPDRSIDLMRRMGVLTKK